ncbi:MAG: restriction endonuclease subunit S, partial [Smithellaceae bacterium]|nr:restriction endonuclease subunit S [Smithellaceae bacterium]
MSAVEGWKTCRLGNLVEVEGGFAFKSADFDDGGIPIIRMSDLDNGHLDLSGSVRIKSNQLKALSKFALHTGDFLVGMSGSIGIYAIVRKQDLPAYLNQRVGRFRLTDESLADYDFITQIARSKPYELHVEMLAAGAAQVNISPSQIESFSFDLPPKPEQTKIAKILSTVDRAIEQTEALIAKQQRIKTGLMQDLLTRGIDEHGNLRSEQTHKFKDSPLGRIPIEWDVEKWSQVCSKIQDGTHFSPRTDSSAEFKYVTSKNIKFGFLDLSDVEYIDKRQHDEIYKRCDVCFGDVLLTKDGANTGNAAINLLNEEFSLLSSVALIRPLKSKLTSMLLLQTILSKSGQRLIKDSMSGLAITRVTLEIINNFLMKVPPVEEQESIGQFLAVQDERVKSEAKKLARLRALKTALMQDL